MGKNVVPIGFKQTKVTVEGVEYTIQKIPFRNYLEMNDRHTNRNGVLLRTPYMEDLLKHCVVSHKLTLNDFDDNFSAGMELVGEVESFLTAKNGEVPNKEESEG